MGNQVLHTDSSQSEAPGSLFSLPPGPSQLRPYHYFDRDAADSPQLVVDSVYSIPSPLDRIDAASSLLTSTFDTVKSTIAQALCWAHEMTGLPWWLTIVLSTTALRLTIVPLTLFGMRQSAKFAAAAKHLPPPFPLPGSSLSFLQAWRIHTAARKRQKGVPSLLWAAAPALVQIPLFLLWIFSVRNMCLESYPGFESGGALWFVDLTSPCHGSLGAVLPLLISLTYLTNVQLSFSGAGAPKTLIFKLYHWTLQFLTLPTLLAALSVPQGVHMYWLTNTSFTLLQSTALRTRAVRSFVGFPTDSAAHAAALALASQGKQQLHGEVGVRSARPGEAPPPPPSAHSAPYLHYATAVHTVPLPTQTTPHTPPEATNSPDASKAHSSLTFTPPFPALYSDAKLDLSQRGFALVQQAAECRAGGRLREAEDLLTKVTALRPPSHFANGAANTASSSTTPPSLSSTIVSARLGLAELSMEEEEWGVAAEHYCLALQDADTYEARMVASFGAGVALARGQKVQEAIGMLQQAAQMELPPEAPPSDETSGPQGEMPLPGRQEDGLQPGSVGASGSGMPPLNAADAAGATPVSCMERRKNAERRRAQAMVALASVLKRDGRKREAVSWLWKAAAYDPGIHEAYVKPLEKEIEEAEKAM